MSGESEWPRTASTVINRLDISNPEEDNARERARDAEAQGLQVVNNDGPSASYSSPPTSAQKRQDFSNEKTSRRDTKLGNYILGRTLGEGEFGKVKLGWKQGGSTQVAVKIIRKEKLNDKTRLEKVNREVRILQGLDHPNIVRLHEMVETDRTMGIVLEYAPCGELFNFILNQRYLKDQHAKRLFAQLVSAVGYLHKKGIIHRDLKLENLLLDRNHNIIVTDFGFANRFDPNDELGEQIEANLHDRKFVGKYKLAEPDANQMRRGDLMATSCGSPCYAAPELVISDGIYTGRKVDVWSIGVILYAMLAGYLPYDDDPRNPDGDNINLLYSYISETDLKFPDYVTPHARDLLKRILKPNPRIRADLFEVARHSWLLGFESVVESITSSSTTAVNLPGNTPADGRATGYLTRSNSARAASNPVSSNASGGLIPKHGNISQAAETPRTRETPRENKRQTVQVEYMPPRQAQQDANDGSDMYNASQQDSYTQDQYSTAQQRPGQYAREDDLNRGQFPTPEIAATKPVPPPKSSIPVSSRPFRDVPRSVTDPNLGYMSNNRPSTQESRLPSRGSYGQPVAAQVATTSAQGRISQPRPPRSAPYSQSGSNQDQSGANNFPSYQNPTVASQQRLGTAEGESRKRGHSRSQTLSDLTSKVFGRSSSTKRPADRRPKPDRSHPPVSLKPAGVDSPSSSRKSSDSRRSFGIGRKSTDFNSNNASNADPPKRTSRRFSLRPRFGSSKPDLTTPQMGEMDSAARRPQVYSPPPIDGASDSRHPTNYSDSQPPVSFQQQPYNTYPRNNTQPQYRAASAGNVTATPQRPWHNQFDSQAGGLEAPSRYDSPAMSYDQREKPQYEIQNLSSSKKMGRGGAAQRVMDFFSGRRRQRNGMA